MATLKLIAAMARNNAQVAQTVFSHPVWKPSETLIGLASCTVRSSFKGQLLNTLSAFVEGCPALATPVWHCIEAAQLLPCIPTSAKFGPPGGIKVDTDMMST